MKANYYKKKPRQLTVEEKCNLLLLPSWGVLEIQLYWCLRERVARELRNKVRALYGTIEYSKIKVKVADVLKMQNTSIKEETEKLNLFKSIHEATEAQNR